MSKQKVAFGLDDVASALVIANQIAAALRSGFEAHAALTGIVAKAQAEGRKTLTPDEWATILGDATAARDALLAKIGK